MSALKDLKIEYVLVNDLKSYDNNPKEHSKRQVLKIVRSIREFGFRNPLLIDKDNNIVAGHGRKLAAENMKLEKVPCFRVDDLSPEQIKAFRIADNAVARGDINEGLLIQELNELKDVNYDLENTGYDLTEIEDLLDDSGNSSDEAPKKTIQVTQKREITCPKCENKFKIDNKGG